MDKICLYFFFWKMVNKSLPRLSYSSHPGGARKAFFRVRDLNRETTCTTLEIDTPQLLHAHRLMRPPFLRSSIGLREVVPHFFWLHLSREPADQKLAHVKKSIWCGQLCSFTSVSGRSFDRLTGRKSHIKAFPLRTNYCTGLCVQGQDEIVLLPISM